ncbi:hypothetical protein D3C87_1739360 [compost metagenome]
MSKINLAFDQRCIGYQCQVLEESAGRLRKAFANLRFNPVALRGTGVDEGVSQPITRRDQECFDRIFEMLVETGYRNQFVRSRVKLPFRIHVLDFRCF